MSTRPKYVAATEFSVAGNHFSVGDEVVDPIVLDAVLRFGDRFVTSNTSRSRKATAADTEQVEAQPPTTPTTTEETP